LIGDAGLVAIGGEADIGVGDMRAGGFEALLAVPGDVGPGGRCFPQAAEDVDLPPRPGVREAGEGGGIEQGSACADSDGAGVRPRIRVSSADL